MKGKIIRAGQSNASSGEDALFFLHEYKQSMNQSCELRKIRQNIAIDNLHKDLRMQEQIAEKIQMGSKKVIHIRKNGFKGKSDL